MPEEPSDLEELRNYISSALSGDMGDDAQEETIIQIFEGELRHKMATLTVLAADNVGSLGNGKDTLIWS